MFYYGGNAFDQWPLNHKVTFNGETKQITVNYGVSELDARIDLYSDWKEWAQLRDNAKFPLALRTIGGDSIDTAQGIYAGDIYFLMNGWQIVIPHSVKINGVLYHDDPISPYVINQGGGVQSVVSNLVQTVVVKETVVAPGPTANQIASQVRVELTPELSKINSQADGLTPSQLTMLTELYAIMGLDPTKPLVVTDTFRSAGAGINQNINSTTNQTTVMRN